MIKCPNCSAELKFNVEDKKVTCEYCGSKFNPKELRTKIQTAEEHNDENKKETTEEPEEILDPNNSFEGKSYACSQCGATLLTFDETAITFCSYCGSQAMIESKMVKINKPDYIIPFKKTKEECIKNYKKKLRKAFFAPNYMKSDIVISKFRGIYIPYGVYELKNDGLFMNKGSKRSHRSGDYVYYDDYTIDSQSDTKYEGVSFDLLSKFYDKYSFSIPFDFKECEQFNPNYLAGFYADTKDVRKDTYDGIAREVAEEDVKKHLKKMKDYRKYGCHDPKMPINVSERKIGMFPVYFLAIRDKKQEHVNYAVINGQSGKVVAGLPLDFKKYIFVSIILSVLIYFLMNNVDHVLLPKHIVKFSIFASIISFIVSNIQLKRIDINRKHLDDLGYIKANKKSDYVAVNRIKTDNTKKNLIILMIMFFIIFYLIILPPLKLSTPPNEYTFIMASWFFSILTIVSLLILLGKNYLYNITVYEGKTKEIMPFGKRFLKYLFKQVIAIIIGVLVLIINPVHDFYYYGAAIISFIIIIISFYDLVKEHNELVSNILPQLEKRGGDENE